MMRILTISLLVVALTGCSVFKDYYQQVVVKPRPWGLGKTPDGSPIFKKGWEDGCDSGLGVYGAQHYRKPAYKFRQDVTLIHNREYYRAWKDAYTYCRWYNWTWSRPYQE